MLGNFSPNYDTIYYQVQPGDSLTKIISQYYGAVSATQRKEIISQIQADNPRVTDQNRIHVNQLLRISIPPLYCLAPSVAKITPILNVDPNLIQPLQQHWDTATPQGRNLLSVLTPIMLGTSAATLTTIDKTFASMIPLLEDMVSNHETYKTGGLSKGQYDYRRGKIVKNMGTQLGPFAGLFSGHETAGEKLRISRIKGWAPTHNITQQITRMERLSRIAILGGTVVLSAVSLGLACHEIARTPGSLEKNQIFMETLGGIVGGIFIGLAISFMFTPAGWVAALVVGTAGAVGGYTAGKLSKKIYTLNFEEVDLASLTGVSQLCKM